MFIGVWVIGLTYCVRVRAYDSETLVLHEDNHNLHIFMELWISFICLYFEIVSSSSPDDSLISYF